VNIQTILSIRVLNSRTISLEHGGHDTNKVATKMTKEEKDKAHGEQSSQRTIQDLTKDLMDLTRGDGHKPEHQLC